MYDFISVRRTRGSDSHLDVRPMYCMLNTLTQYPLRACQADSGQLWVLKSLWYWQYWLLLWLNGQ